jgi:amino acid adenylation domain-containing protein
MENNRAQTDASSEKLRLLKQMLAKKGIHISKEQAIGKRAADGPGRLSFAQQRLWFLSRLDPDSPAYNLCSAIRLEGQLDSGALEKTLSEVVSRHESLRTRFVATDQGPLQVIDPAAPAALPVIDLSSMAEEERDVELRRRALEDCLTPFDFERGPLFRVSLYRLTEQEHAVTFVMHHIVSDAWSMDLLVREVSALYNAFSTGSPSPLGGLAIQYADYAEWQRDWLQGERLDRQLGYWKKQLAGATPSLDLPGRRPRASADSFEGESHTFLLSEALSKGLRSLAERQDATLYMLMLAAFQSLLCRLSGQEDIIVGSFISNRRRPELEAVIGFFVNTLAFRTDFKGDPTFKEILARVRATALSAYEHQDLPFEKLVDELRPERVKDRNPIFQTGFSLRHATNQTLDLSDLRVSGLAIGRTTVQFDLALDVIDTARGLSCTFIYRKNLFDPGAVRGMAGRFQVLLETLVENPERRLYELPLLTPEEREKLLVEWNQTTRRHRVQSLAHRLLEEQAGLNPDQVAVVCEDRQVDYRQLNARANQLARRLQSLGAGPESPVAICLPRGVEMVISALAVLKCGGCYVPIELSQPLERQSYILENARVGVIITDTESEERISSGWAQVVRLDEEEDFISLQDDSNLDLEVDGDNLAYIIYTSGSSGMPKGVMIPHRGLVNYLLWSRDAYRAAEGTGSIVHSPLGFDLTVTSLLTPLAAGQQVTLAADAESVEGLRKELARGADYTLVKLTPSHLEMLKWETQAETMQGKVRAMVIGGEELRGETVEQWREKAPGTRLINEYGPTETVVGCSIYEVGEGERIEGVAPIGRPIWNVRMYVLGRGQELMAAGATGEIYIGGEAVGRGYVGKADQTAERFLPDPYGGEAGARFYRTGDLGRFREDGNIEYLGRRDGQVKLRGYRIELGEIEEQMRKVPGVKEAVAAIKGEGAERRLVGYVVEAGPEVSEKALKDQLSRVLPEYMTPSSYVKIEKIPVNGNGKVDRAALPATGRAAETGVEFVEARTPVEVELARVWGELLGVSRVGVHDNFFELGGHSLLLTQLATRIFGAFGVSIPIKILFDAPTISQMTLAIAELQFAQADSLEANELLEELQGLSPEEAQRLLAAEQAAGGTALN